MRWATLTMAAALLATPVAAQTTLPVSPPPQAEVATPEAILAATYAVISGPAGQARDWARMRGLFVPGGMLEVTRSGPAGATTRVLTVEDYIAASSKTMETTGFFEHGVVGHVWRYGHIATVTSPYESRHAPGDPKPFARGINVFQLMFDGTRWWVVSIYWEGETPAFPLPADAEAVLKAK